MSASYVNKLVATIPSGQAASNAIVSAQIHDAAAIGIISPATLDAHTYAIEVCHDLVPGGSSNWSRLKDRDTNDAAIPAADSAMWYPELGTFTFRIIDVSGNVAADRSFTILKHHTI